jgi:hypothetical protein
MLFESFRAGVGAGPALYDAAGVQVLLATRRHEHGVIVRQPAVECAVTRTAARYSSQTPPPPSGGGRGPLTKIKNVLPALTGPFGPART